MRVNKSNFYKQCRLKQGAKIQIAWIPEAIAKEGYMVSVANNATDLDPENKWEVLFAGVKVPASYVLTSRDAHKSHRSRTDV